MEKMQGQLNDSIEVDDKNVTNATIGGVAFGVAISLYLLLLFAGKDDIPIERLADCCESLVPFCLLIAYLMRGDVGKSSPLRVKLGYAFIALTSFSMAYNI